jgi:hypothetical protein
LIIVYGSDTTKFTMWNTLDYTTIKIAEIINTYLTAGKKFSTSKEWIKREDECWKDLPEKWKAQKKLPSDSAIKNGA